MLLGMDPNRQIHLRMRSHRCHSFVLFTYSTCSRCILVIKIAFVGLDPCPANIYLSILSHRSTIKSSEGFRKNDDTLLSLQLTSNNILQIFPRKQAPRGVPKKRCFENMQQIYSRTPMPKCDFNKVVFSCKFAAYFQNTFS